MPPTAPRLIQLAFHPFLTTSVFVVEENRLSNPRVRRLKGSVKTRTVHSTFDFREGEGEGEGSDGISIFFLRSSLDGRIPDVLISTTSGIRATGHRTSKGEIAQRDSTFLLFIRVPPVALCSSCGRRVARDEMRLAPGTDDLLDGVDEVGGHEEENRKRTSRDRSGKRWEKRGRILWSRRMKVAFRGTHAGGTHTESRRTRQIFDFRRLERHLPNSHVAENVGERGDEKIRLATRLQPSPLRFRSSGEFIAVALTSRRLNWRFAYAQRAIRTACRRRVFRHSRNASCREDFFPPPSLSLSTLESCVHPPGGIERNAPSGMKLLADLFAPALYAQLTSPRHYKTVHGFSLL